MVFIIAEIGVNHVGDMSRAMRMIQVAADVGADAVKFQSFTADKLGYEPDLTALLRDWQLTAHDHFRLKERADKIGIEFMSTPFDHEWCDFLVSLGVKRLKISSGKVKDINFVRHVASKGLPVIMSNGMATESELYEARKALWNADVPFTLLYCVSDYPAPLHKIDFRKMRHLHVDGLTQRVGYSDHTANPATCVLAAASGALIVEAHLTLDRSLPGPDHAASLLPEEFAEMVRGVRNVG